jgi:hypothetical protein
MKIGRPRKLYPLGYNARKVPVVYGIHPAYQNWVRGRAVPALALNIENTHAYKTPAS